MSIDKITQALKPSEYDSKINEIIDTSLSVDLSNISEDGLKKIHYPLFSINQGNVDSEGNNAALTYSGSTLTCAPCKITTIDGRQIEHKWTATKDCSNISNGTYYVFLAFTRNELFLDQKFHVGKTPPLSPVANSTYWIDTRNFPLILSFYDGSSWIPLTHVVYIGQVTISSGTITDVMNRSFNASPADRKLIEAYKYLESFYNIYSDGWCEQGGVIYYSYPQSINLLKPYVTNWYNIQVSLKCSQSNGFDVKPQSLWINTIYSNKFSITSMYLNSNNNIWQFNSNSQIHWRTTGYVERVNF